MVKVGGLADVVGSLPKALRTLGHDVRILIPQYASLDTQRFPLTPVKKNFKLSMPRADPVRQSEPDYLQRGTGLYAGKPAIFRHGEIYGTFDLERFFFFSRAVFEILPELDWQPEILHCHDWLTSLVILWQKKAGYPYSTVFTIHNLAYQGFFDDNFMNSHDLRKDWDSFPPDAPRPPLQLHEPGGPLG